MGFENGGIVNPGVTLLHAHPWRSEPVLPFNPTPEQLEHAATIVAFQDEIELIDESFLEEN